MNRINDIIEQINLFGKEKIPFLFIFDFELSKPLLYKLNDINENQIQYKVNELTNIKMHNNPQNSMQFNKIPIPLDEYKLGFDKVTDAIKTGETYLCNLTFPSEIICNYSLSDIFQISNAPYKLNFNDEFIVFTPECFVKIKNGRIFSYPMKGTIDASIPNAKELILSDPKELAEHTTIVDLLRNDLSIVASNIKVEEFRYIEHLTTNQKDLYQVSSRIAGDLPKDYNSILGDIIFALLPAGSICGAPKKRTVEIIEAVEHQPRGYYTGVFGIFDGINLDSAVMIRFIEKQNEKLIFRSGGGITSQSELNKEYQELVDKVYVPII